MKCLKPRCYRAPSQKSAGRYRPRAPSHPARRRHPDVISSHRNALVKRIRKLQQKKYREKEGAFFVEGIRIVLTALEQNAPVQTLVYAPDLLTSETALAVLEAQKQAGRDVVAMTADVFQTLSGRDNAVGLGAILQARLLPLSAISVEPNAILVALDRISDPGNLGTIIRTVDAVGGAGVILVGSTTDPFHPTAMRASMGALFNMPLSTVEEPRELLGWARRHNMQIVATSAHAPHSFWQAPYQTPLLVLIGSEGEGLDPALQDIADLSVSIPMHGVASSLNVAVATGLILYEVRRSLSEPGSLSP